MFSSSKRELGEVLRNFDLKASSDIKEAKDVNDPFVTGVGFIEGHYPYDWCRKRDTLYTVLKYVRFFPSFYVNPEGLVQL